jgi:hypothetical protein
MKVRTIKKFTRDAWVRERVEKHKAAAADTKPKRSTGTHVYVGEILRKVRERLAAEKG